MFASPSKQAQQAAGVTAGAVNQEINNLEQYESDAEKQQRAAIAGLGNNPYFGAAAGQSPANYQTDPTKTATFTEALPSAPPSSPNFFAAPAQRQAQPIARSPGAR